MASFNRGANLLATALACALLTPGCMKVGPHYARPKTVVAHSWLESKDDRIKTEPPQYRAWWEVFGDQSLNKIIDRAYRANLSLKVAGVRVLEARAQLGIAIGEIYPQTQQLTGSLAFNRFSQRDPSAASSRQTAIQFSYTQDQIGLNASWEIDFWGKFRRSIESADASLLAAVADYDSALVSLTADAANAYIQIRTLERRLEIARSNFETQTESLRITEAMFKGGAATERDVEQAKTILFSTRATIPTLEAQLRQAKDALSVLLGLPPSDLAEYLDGISNIPAPPPDVAVGIPADLLRRRPDVRSAELQAAAQCAQIGVAKADLLPAVSIIGSFGFLSSDVGTFGLSDIAGWKARTGSIGPSFQWNILNYGRISNNVRLQDARFQELLIAYQNTVLTAQQQVEDSLAGFLRAQENAEYLAKSALAAKNAMDLSIVQYQLGSADFTTVLTAQQALLVAQDSLASAMGNISVNLVGVYRALGGGWQLREGQDLIPPDIKEAMAKRTYWGKLLSPSVYMPSSAEPESTIRSPDW